MSIIRFCIFIMLNSFFTANTRKRKKGQLTYPRKKKGARIELCEIENKKTNSEPDVAGCNSTKNYNDEYKQILQSMNNDLLLLFNKTCKEFDLFGRKIQLLFKNESQIKNTNIFELRFYLKRFYYDFLNFKIPYPVVSKELSLFMNLKELFRLFVLLLDSHINLIPKSKIRTYFVKFTHKKKVYLDRQDKTNIVYELIQKIKKDNLLYYFPELKRMFYNLDLTVLGFRLSRFHLIISFVILKLRSPLEYNVDFIGIENIKWIKLLRVRIVVLNAVRTYFSSYDEIDKLISVTFVNYLKVTQPECFSGWTNENFFLFIHDILTDNLLLNSTEKIFIWEIDEINDWNFMKKIFNYMRNRHLLKE